MIAGFIGVYIHSDAISPNKAAALARILTQTDFAARTKEVQGFARLVAMRATGALVAHWTKLVALYPELEEERQRVQGIIGEMLTVAGISLQSVRPLPQEDES